MTGKTCECIDFIGNSLIIFFFLQTVNEIHFRYKILNCVVSCNFQAFYFEHAKNNFSFLEEKLRKIIYLWSWPFVFIAFYLFILFLYVYIFRYTKYQLWHVCVSCSYIFSSYLCVLKKTIDIRIFVNYTSTIYMHVIYILFPLWIDSDSYARKCMCLCDFIYITFVDFIKRILLLLLCLFMFMFIGSRF